jgi:hypothetical protein
MRRKVAEMSKRKGSGGEIPGVSERKGRLK